MERIFFWNCPKCKIIEEKVVSMDDAIRAAEYHDNEKHKGQTNSSYGWKTKKEE
jgi:hypothetical protein